MKTSTLFSLLSFVLAPTISSSHSHEPPSQLQNIELPSKIDQDLQDDLASPEHKTDRDLYSMETIDMGQEPCMSMPVVVEEIVDDDDDYTDYLTFPPTQRPTAPPTTQPPTQSPNVSDPDDGNDDKANGDFEKIESIDDSSDTASSSSSSTTHSTNSSKSTKSGKSSKNSKSKSTKSGKSGSRSSTKSGKSGSRSSQDSRDNYDEGASTGGLNKVSGMIQYAEAINAAPVMGPIVFVSKYMSGVFVSAVIFAFQLLH